MAIADVYFKRRMRERGEYSDVYQYEELPQKFRVQIVHIWRETIKPDLSIIQYNTENLIGGNKSSRTAYETVHKILLKELGLFELPVNHDTFDGYFHKVSNYFLNVDDVELVLTVLELMCKMILLYQNKDFKNHNESEAIEETNTRFKENGIGYQYENGQIIRVDSQFIHAEVVKPALELLNKSMYKGAQEEFLKAHEHYRHGDYGNVLSECLKAFESTMLTICDTQGWEYDKKAAANTLVNICMDNNLIPDFWQSQFNSLKSLLTSSIATPRNKLGSHGKGNNEKVIPEYLASYVLHMTASTILFLAKAEQALE